MTYIFLIASFNAFFFLMLLSHKRNIALHDRVLKAWLVYLGFSTALYGFSSYDLFRETSLLYSGFVALFTLHGPFLVKDDSVEKGRAYVAAYLDYTHTLEAIDAPLEDGTAHESSNHAH